MENRGKINILDYEPYARKRETLERFKSLVESFVLLAIDPGINLTVIGNFLKLRGDSFIRSNILRTPISGAYK